MSKLSNIEHILNYLSTDWQSLKPGWTPPLLGLYTFQTIVLNFNVGLRLKEEGRFFHFIKVSVNYYPCDFHPPCTNQSRPTYESFFLRFPLGNGSYFITGVICASPRRNFEDFNSE